MCMFLYLCVSIYRLLPSFNPNFDTMWCRLHIEILSSLLLFPHPCASISNLQSSLQLTFMDNILCVMYASSSTQHSKWWIMYTSLQNLKSTNLNRLTKIARMDGVLMLIHCSLPLHTCFYSYKSGMTSSKRKIASYAKQIIKKKNTQKLE